MNTVQRKIKILKLAKDRLANLPLSSPLGICGAIADVCTSMEDYRVMRVLRAYIQQSLKGHTWLTSWLHDRRLPSHFKAVRAARIAWINWMIASLEGKN